MQASELNPSASIKLSRRHVVAATIGNALEFYDFMTYTFFAIQIGHAFFPSDDGFVSLMLSLATFAIGFVTRPLGGVVIGRYSDRAGRRPAMVLTFMLMGGSIIVLALTPSYGAIGIAAPVIVIVARMVQGFSLGGEVGPTTAFLLEAAPIEKRGIIVSWQLASQLVASVAGGLVGLVLAAVLSAQVLDVYGWRIAFLIGALALPYGLWIRRSLPETLHEPEEHTVPPSQASTGVGLARSNKRLIALGLVGLAYGTISTYTSQYFATYAQDTLHMSTRAAFAATVSTNGAAVVAILLGGWVSDRIGRKPVMIWPNVAFLLIVYPLFIWIAGARSSTVLFVGAGIFGFMRALGFAAFFAALTESLPKPIRGSGLAIVYATAIAIFGGTAQNVVAWLIHVTGNPLAITWYVMLSGVIAVVAMAYMVESAPARRKLAPEPA